MRFSAIAVCLVGLIAPVLATVPHPPNSLDRSNMVEPDTVDDRPTPVPSPRVSRKARGRHKLAHPSPHPFNQSSILEAPRGKDGKHKDIPATEKLNAKPNTEDERYDNVPASEELNTESKHRKKTKSKKKDKNNEMEKREILHSNPPPNGEPRAKGRAVKPSLQQRYDCSGGVTQHSNPKRRMWCYSGDNGLTSASASLSRTKPTSRPRHATARNRYHGSTQMR
jgi:hypothetical protein